MSSEQASGRLLSIVVCTYNRADLLIHCLASIAEMQPLNASKWELLLIDNNSTDQTTLLVKQYINDHSDLEVRYFLETKQGLSHARNRGYQEAQTEWVLYLDDDAKVKSNFAEQALSLVENGQYDIVGGVYLPWYHYGKPHWFKDRFGSNRLEKVNQFTHSLKGFYASGGVMLWRKSLLFELGGFDPKVGMIGNKLAYGEETFVQKTAEARGIFPAYDPELIIYHVVAPYKLSVDHFIQRRYALGRDMVIGKQLSTRSWYLVAQVGFGLLKFMVLAIVNGFKYLFRKDYYQENWLIDSLWDASMRAGIVYTTLLEHKSKKLD